MKKNNNKHFSSFPSAFQAEGTWGNHDADFQVCSALSKYGPHLLALL